MNELKDIQWKVGVMFFSMLLFFAMVSVSIMILNIKTVEQIKKSEKNIILEIKKYRCNK